MINRNGFSVDPQFGRNVPYVTFKFRTGSSLTLPYSNLFEMQKKGDNEIELVWPQLHILLMGQNLELLHSHVCLQRVTEIREGDDSLFVNMDNKECLIMQIKINRS